jgi:conjugative relaxase-like TrwC/TraI family protein
VVAIRSPAQVAYYLAAEAGASMNRVAYLLGQRTDARTVEFIGGGAVPELLTWPVGRPLADRQAAKLVFQVASGVSPATGERIVAPRLRVAEAAKLPAAPAVTAVVVASGEVTVAAAARLYVSDYRRRLWERTVRQVRRIGDAHTAAVTDLASLLSAADLHPHTVFGQIRWAAAWALRRERVDTATALHAIRFETPKSVGLAVATAHPERARELLHTWTASVRETVEALMGDAAYGMTGHHGDGQVAARIVGSGWAGTCTVEMTSRAGDPHLHAHVMIVNATRCTDTVWRAVGAGGAELRAGGALSNARAQRLFRQQTAAAGHLEWTFDPASKTWRVAGITITAEELFSKRHQAISAELGHTEQAARVGGRRRDAAAEARTRGPKSPVVETLGQIRARVIAEAAAADVTITSPDAVSAERAGADPRSWAPDRWIAEVSASLTEHASVICERDVWRCAHTLAPPEWTELEVARTAHLVLGSTELIPLPPATGLRGQLAGAARYTTATILTAEQTVFGLSAAGVGQARHVLTVAEVAHLLDRYEIDQGWAFTDEQRALAGRFLAGGNSIDVAEGGPGCGKTSVMDAVRTAYESSGLTVFGVSTSAAAAANLGAEAAIDTATIAGLLAAVENERAPAMDVLIIDEAAMAGVRDLAAILTWAQQTGVDVRMIGDSKQLGSVAAGNTYRRQVEQLDGIRLRDNNRQLRSHERDAVTRLQAGDTFDGLAIFAAHGQVSVAMTDPERVTNTIAGWALDAARYPDPLQRVDAVAILAVRRDRVDQLNDAARAHARASGWLGTDTAYRTPGGRSVVYAPGDPILLKRNDYQRPAGEPALRNNTMWVVRAIDPNTRQMTIARAHRGNIEHATLEAGYVAAHTRHGYATTTHAAQGRTTDYTHVVPDGADPHTLLVQASRHRHAVSWYIDGGGLTDSHDQWHQLAEQPAHTRARWAADRLANGVGAFDDEYQQQRPDTATAHDGLRRATPQPHAAPLTPSVPRTGRLSTQQRAQAERALAARRRRQLATDLSRRAMEIHGPGV